MDTSEKEKANLSLICLSIAENSEFWPLCLLGERDVLGVDVNVHAHRGRSKVSEKAYV